jgi:hypothetical protein
MVFMITQGGTIYDNKTAALLGGSLVILGFATMFARPRPYKFTQLRFWR